SRAGYDSGAMSSFLAQLRAHAALRAQINGDAPDAIDSFDIMATHPRTLDRIKRATTAAGPAPGHARNLHRKAYQGAIDGMIFGDDPNFGVIRGRAFAHRALRFRFEVPEGFTLINRPNAVIARNKQLRSTIIFDLDGRRSGGAMTGYLVRDWAKSRMNDVNALTVNGLPAATGWFVTDTKKGQMVVRFLAIRGGPSEIFRFMFITPPSMTERLSVPFRRTTYSFGRLSRKEAAQITPLRLTIRRRRNESLKSLVRRMQVDSHADGWFELLNGLASGKPPKRGDAVRLVV
nr:peptidase M48 [Rhodospirillaceae bacterium]